MLGEMYSLNQLSMNTQAHGQNASLHTDPLTKSVLSQRQKSHGGKEPAPSRRERHPGAQPQMSTTNDHVALHLLCPSLPTLSLPGFIYSQDAMLFTTYIVARLCNLKREAFNLCNKSKAQWEVNVTAILRLQVLQPHTPTSPTRLKPPCSQGAHRVHFHIPQALSSVSATR